MPNIATLEVFRPVYLDKGSDFIEQIETKARQVFDTNGSAVTANRPDNIVTSTIKRGARVYSEEELVRYHLSVAGTGKHLGKKIVSAQLRIEEGLSSRSGIFGLNEAALSLEEHLDLVAIKEFGLAEGGPMEAEVTEFRVIEDNTLFPNKKLFVFATEVYQPQAKGVLRQMDTVVRARLNDFAGTSLSSIENGPRTGLVPFAETRSRDEARISRFLNHATELLPMHITLGSVDTAARV